MQKYFNSAHEEPQHIADVYKNTDKNKVEKIKKIISEQSTEKLLKVLPIFIKNDWRIEMITVNQELTERGYPPCLRNLEGLKDKNYEHPDRQVIDLDWIAKNYTINERKAYGFFKKIFNPWAFIDTAKIIWNKDLRPMWKIVLGLALTPKQQWLCHYIGSQKIKKQKLLLEKNRDEVIKALRAAKYSRGLTIISQEQRASHDRLVSLWDVAHIGGWRPTVVANLYNLKTGKIITRQMCSKLLRKLNRDAWRFILDVSH